MSTTTISPLRAATTLAVWGAALSGGLPADSAMQVLSTPGMPVGARGHSAQSAALSGLPAPGEAHGGVLELLVALRQGGPAQLILPAPGDVRGLPAGADIVAPALDAGAVVVLPWTSVGLVPTHGHWRAYPCAAHHASLRERDARRLVDDALQEASAALLRADVARSAGDPRSAVRERILQEEVPLPPGTPAAARELLARSTTLAAVLSVAADHETAAATAGEMRVVDRALAPLAAAVREAHRTAVAIAVTALHPAGTDALNPRAVN